MRLVACAGCLHVLNWQLAGHTQARAEQHKQNRVQAKLQVLYRVMHDKHVSTGSQI